MLIKAAKWGNSLGVRLPKDLARQAQISEGDEVQIEYQDNKLIITPTKKQKKYTLEELLEGMSAENLHSEINWGNPVGKEVW